MHGWIRNVQMEGTLWARAEQLTGRVAPALGHDADDEAGGATASSHLQRLHALFGEQTGQSPKKRLRRKTRRSSTSGMDRGGGGGTSHAQS